MNELARLLREALDTQYISETNENLDAALALVEKGEVLHTDPMTLAGGHKTIVFTRDREQMDQEYLVIPLSRPVEVEERHRSGARQIIDAYLAAAGQPTLCGNRGAVDDAARKLAELEQEREK